ncbi:MAG TPA: hypothetical protein VD997_17440 [Phycisphaerales bacterium]|nr:hypothetical protein [Phycisphaerales bacterium]
MAVTWPLQRRWTNWVEGGIAGTLWTTALSTRPVAILLGAAGLGKSFEIEQLARAEEAQGRRIARVELATAMPFPSDLRAALEKALGEAGPEGAIYIDSLDEALVPLPTAAAIIEGWIKQLQTAPFIRIACRSAVWPKTLQRALELKYSPEAVTTAELQPLNEEDITSVCAAEKLDAQAFLADLRSVGAMTLAEQPLTLALLVAEHAAGGTLTSSRAELFDRCIRRLCTEAVERLEHGTATSVPVQTLIEVAERLATFTVLSGREVITLDDSADGAVLTAFELGGLPSGSSPQISSALLTATLRTGLFRSAGLRASRFLHRQFAEFLAGRRLGNTPAAQARALLARGNGWASGVAGPLRETAASAAMFSSALARWISQTDPEVVGLSDIADERLRRDAFLSLVQAYRAHRLTDAQVPRDDVSLLGLKYLGAADDIRPLLQERARGAEDLNAFLIEVVESWGLVELAEELAELALDERIALSTRKTAAYAIAKIAPARTKHRLKPLIITDSDPDSELRGIALRCNWPGNLSTGELFAALAAPRRRFHFGSVEAFILSLEKSEFDAADDRVAGLHWAKPVLSDRMHSHSGQDLARRVARAAIEEVDRPEVLASLIELITTAASHHADSVFFEDTDKEAAEGIRTWLSTNSDARRGILTAVARSVQDGHPFWGLNRQLPGLIVIDDFHWLLQESLDPNKKDHERRNLAELASWLPWQSAVPTLEAWLGVREQWPISEVIKAPLSVALGSAEAKQMREWHYADRTPRRQKRRSSKPPQPERIRELLRRAREDPMWFGTLARELALDESTGQWRFERVIDRTPGWAAAPSPVRAEIVDAAKRRLLDQREPPDAERDIELNSVLSDGAMEAIFLLQRVEREWLSGREKPWWQRWCWYILRELRMNLYGESEPEKQDILEMVVQHAGDCVRREIQRMAGRAGAESLLQSILEASKTIADEHLVIDVARMIQDDALTGDALTITLSFILEQSDGFTDLATRLLGPNHDGDIRVRAAVALLEYRPAEAWGKVLEFLRSGGPLARLAVGKYAYGERLERSATLSTLGPARVGELLDVLFVLFPPAEDPEHEGAHAVTERDAAVWMRGSLLNWLSSQDSHIAVQALRALELHHGERNPWLRRPRAEVERRYRQSRWTPIPTRTIALILADSTTRLVRSAQDVVDHVVEVLLQFQAGLQSQSQPEIEDLWNTPHGEPPTPKLEERVSDKIRNAIEAGFAPARAITANREVQIRKRFVPASAGGAPGSRPDVVVSVPAIGTVDGEGAIIVPVEVKRSMNPEARTGLRDQLSGRYLVELGADRGIFVVAFFDTPGLAPPHRPVWSSIDAAWAELEDQSRTIEAESGGNVLVTPFVLDARLK